MEKEYRNYSELPTMTWLFGSMSFAAICLLSHVFFNFPEPFSLIILAVGVVMFSISGAVFIVALVFPLILNSVQSKKTRKQENLPEETL